MPEGKISVLKPDKGSYKCKLKLNDGSEKDFNVNQIAKDGAGDTAKLKKGDAVTFDAEYNADGSIAIISNVRKSMRLRRAPTPPRYELEKLPSLADLLEKDLGNSDPIEPPYHFVPMAQRPVTDTPIWHDGRNAETGLLSGELRCSLHALTPLLVANQHYDAEHVQDAVEEEEIDEEGKPKIRIRLPAAWGIAEPVDQEKKILEPLRLPDGRVLLAGSGIKGMIRQSVCSLLSAPMEKVAEQSYSYRPNLGTAARLSSKPAVIDTINPNGSIDIRYPDADEEAVFVYPDAERQLTRLYSKGGMIGSGTTLSRLDKQFKTIGRAPNQITLGNVSKLSRHATNTFTIIKDYYYCHYSYGIDGQGILSKSKKQVYTAALLGGTSWATATLPAPLVQHYQKTLAHLKDSKSGHISSRHPGTFDRNSAKSAIDRLNLQAGQLIYIEIDNRGQVTSFGHHYQYRWRYAGTVRQEDISGTERSCLKPLPKENLDNEKKPEQLTGGRLFFGYVSGKGDKSDNQKKNTNYQKLAGRIAVNIAVEQTNAPNDDTRFLDEGRAIALKILGQPRPSAVEFYLQQKGRQGNNADRLATYGDLHTDKSADLNGRKYYWHQPTAGRHDYRADTDATKSKQAAIARFVSAPGSEFRFCVRFRDLRPWELGLLLLILEPERVFTLPDEALPANLRQSISALKQQECDPTIDYGGQALFAHKLGYGRPLGFGSVKIGIDDIRLWNDGKLTSTADKTQLDAMQQAAGKLDAAVWRDWLTLKRYRGRTKASYPEKNGTIFNYHTDLRQKHAKARRS